MWLQAAVLSGAGRRRRRLSPRRSATRLQGSDVVEGRKLYARVFRALSSFGIRI